MIFILMIVVGLLFNACQLTTASGKSIKKLGLLHKSFKEQHWLTIQGRVSRGVYQWGSLSIKSSYWPKATVRCKPMGRVKSIDEFETIQDETQFSLPVPLDRLDQQGCVWQLGRVILRWQSSRDIKKRLAFIRLGQSLKVLPAYRLAEYQGVCDASGCENANQTGDIGQTILVGNRSYQYHLRLRDSRLSHHDQKQHHN